MKQLLPIALVFLLSCGIPTSSRPPNGKSSETVEVFFRTDEDTVVKTLENIIEVYEGGASYTYFYALSVEHGGKHRVYDCQTKYMGWRWGSTVGR